MKIFHLSYHVGCINDLNYVFKTLGHSIDFEKVSYKGCTVTPAIAAEYWERNKEKLQSYDIIITSDTVALSYIFLLRLKELMPHLIILNSNRFDYGMYGDKTFYELIRSAPKHLNKVTYIPYTVFEQIWCAKKDVFTYETPITPIGKWLPDSIYTNKGIIDDFGTINRSQMIRPDTDTIFIQTYFNHTQFMKLADHIASKGVSIAQGGYNYLSEIASFKGLVVLPDAFSKYFAFESIQNNILVYLPSQKFLLELMQKSRYFFNIEGSGGRLQQEWVNLCEWYHYPETRIYFDSFDDLVEKIKGTSAAIRAEKSKWMNYYGGVIEKRELISWKNICDKIDIYRSNAFL